MPAKTTERRTSGRATNANQRTQSTLTALKSPPSAEHAPTLLPSRSPLLATLPRLNGRPTSSPKQKLQYSAFDCLIRSPTFFSPSVKEFNKLNQINHKENLNIFSVFFQLFSVLLSSSGRKTFHTSNDCSAAKVLEIIVFFEEFLELIFLRELFHFRLESRVITFVFLFLSYLCCF